MHHVDLICQSGTLLRPVKQIRLLFALDCFFHIPHLIILFLYLYLYLYLTMPRPALPPTPAASTDITGKPADPSLAHDPSWSLPPAALAASAGERSNSRGSVSSSSVASCNASDSSYHPTSPVTHSSPTNARKRPSASNGAASAKDDYNLPPPPTRLRKIIQMKPKSADDENERTTQDVDTSTSAGTAKAKGNNNSAAGGNGKGKKNGNGSTAAGRKIARKTAHSLIERRRRSKMNEEFGTLKDMIPACAGQEMHKLAILQVSKKTSCRGRPLTTIRRASNTCVISNIAWQSSKPQIAPNNLHQTR